MKLLFKILIILLLLSSCVNEKQLEGTWYGAYSIKNGKKEPLTETTLLDFKSEQLLTIKIRDFSTGELDKVIIDTSEYQFSSGKLIFNSYSPKTELAKDSLILELENRKLVFRRIPKNLKGLNINPDCFLGSYSMTSENYQNSINFVNDSLLIYTGEYDQNFPGKKWQIIEYGGFNFLNIHTELQPVTIIKSCNSSGINLVYPSIQIMNIKLKPSTSEIDKENLIGEWREIKNSVPDTTTSPNLTEKDLKLTVNIKSDSIEISSFKRTKTFKWNLTSDGKRIYFIERFLENEGSWKLLDLSESSLTVRISSKSGFKEEIVQFEKIKNGR